MDPKHQATLAWHTLPLASLESELDATDNGLTKREAAVRLTQFGLNRLPQKPPIPLWQVVIRQFFSPLIYILVLAAVVSLAIGDFKDASFIAGVLVLNAVIGAYQEWKAEQSGHALRKLLQIRAAVERDGEVQEISAEEVVPGDILLLESGNRVPADIRLLWSHGLESDESLLTGESTSVLKDACWNGPESTPVGDRLNMAYAGSIIARGRAKGMVVATGLGTNFGQIALDVLGDTGGRPPLLVRMERFTRVIAVAVLLASATIAGLGVMLGGYEISDMFIFGVALTVAAIPEGLPVAMTVALAIATKRMAKRKLIVRRLTAVEGLGSCTMIATDKTGTLTCNELTLREVCLPNGDRIGVTGEGFEPIGDVQFHNQMVSPGSQSGLESFVRAGVLCNEADLHQSQGSWVWHGDSVDVALLSFGQKFGWSRAAVLEQNPQISEIPFEPESQFSASFHQDNVNGRVRVFVKGAPERIITMCREANNANFNKSELESMANAMAKQGFRVLALAEGEIESSIALDTNQPLPTGLRFLGFAGMIDPLRHGAKDAVHACNRAGIVVSMVTGDHRITALAIARELGLADDESQVMTGEELLNQSPEEVAQAVSRIRVFARVAPRQKLQIVEAARRAGHFVAVTGDGVNDAPALRAANIGVAMGKSGTDVAREAAELVISDDNFATIVAGVEEGRVAYDNIRKVIYLLISTGAAELVLMALAVATGTPYLPLLPVQILWLNLVTSGIQDVALAFEPNEGDAIERQPRAPNERIFNRLMIERTLVAALAMGVVGFFTFRWFLADSPSEAEVKSARNALLLLMVLFENIHIGNCRSETKSALRLSPLRSPILLGGTLAAFLIHLAAMHTSFGQSLLDAEPVSIENWALLLLLALIIFPVMELHKWTWSIRQRHANHALDTASVIVPVVKS